jgi:hypothetical protein
LPREQGNTRIKGLFGLRPREPYQTRASQIIGAAFRRHRFAQHLAKKVIV